MKVKKSAFFLLTIIMILMSCVNVEKKWEEAKRTNTVEGYENFVSEYPKSEYSQDAINAIVELKGYQDPYFINWIIEDNERKSKELKRADNFIYTINNIEKWGKLFVEWDNLSEPYLIEEINYDEYGLYDEIILKTSKRIIAKKTVFRSPYNPTQITGIGYSYPDKEKIFLEN